MIFLPGVIPFFVNFFFREMMKRKAASLDKIIQMVRDFRYGHLDKRNKPSVIKLDKKNVGQNASQIYCLMKNLPFIFYEFKHKMEREWKTMETLLQIMQILYSVRIPETDVKRLENLIRTHLSDLVVVHSLKLIFKHHQLVHYPNRIRESGPVIHGWMMRYEAKHKCFTNHAHTMNNFINVAKSLAVRHQELMCRKMTITPNINPSKTREPLLKCHDHQKYLHHFIGRNLENVYRIEFLHLSCYEYRAGSMLVNNGKVFEILYVFSDDTKYFLLCAPYRIESFDSTRNSFQIIEEEENSSVLFNINALKVYESYDKIRFDDKFFIFAETLDVYNPY